MAIQITTHGESYQLHPEYQIPEVERGITEAITLSKPAVTFRGPEGDLIVFSIGGTTPLALSEYDPSVISFGS